MNEWTFEDLKRLMDTFHPVFEDSAKEKKRRRIVDAASELFIRHGYRKTSVDEVARKAGVAKGTLYLYFATKADLLIQAVAEEKRVILERFKPIVDGEMPGRERLKAWLREVLLSVPKMPLSARMMSGDREIHLVLEAMDSALLEQAIELNIDFLTAMLVEACEIDVTNREPLRRRARLLMALFQSSGYFTDESLRLGLTLEELASELVDTLVDGLFESIDVDLLRSNKRSSVSLGSTA